MDNAQKAISLALLGNWEEAIKVNLSIIKENPDDIDSLNRIGRAYCEIGKISKAKSFFKKALSIDPFDPIAQKAYEKLKKIKSKSSLGIIKTSDPTTFLEEPGKTKVVSLINLGQCQLLNRLETGEEVSLTTHAHRVCITTLDKKYIGKLPDDLAARIKILVAGGNEYKTYIKSVDKSNVRIFIKEIKKSKEFSNISSFPSEKMDYIPYAPPELINKEKPKIEHIEEEEY